jgi:ketosteroid isomerase-like protein
MVECSSCGARSAGGARFCASCGARLAPESAASARDPGKTVTRTSGGLMGTDEQGALRRLVDKDEIIDLVRRYSYCVDHKLYDELAELFTDDCVVDYGPGVAPPARGRAAFRAMFGLPGGGFAATSHHNANVFVTFEDDDHAAVRASVYAWHRTHDGATPRMWGYYHDTVARGQGGWRIATRQLRVLGVEGWDVEWHPAVEER